MFSVPNVYTLFICAKKNQKRPVPPPRAIPFKKNPVHAHDKQDGF